MSGMNKFLIGPINEGLRKDLKPYATPEDSFVNLTNALQWRGRIISRQGYTSLGQLSTDGGTTFLGLPVMGLRTQELFGIGDQALIAFDTQKAYSFSGTNFTTLTSVMPVTWSGTDSQFFYTINYANAFWVTNSKPGLNGFNLDRTGTTFSGQTTLGGNFFVNVASTGNTFQVNDEVYFINVNGSGSPNNLRQGIVTVAGNPFTVKATDGLGAFTNGSASSGMVLSTTRSVTGQDGIRYYGQLSNGTGWANYNPPLDPNTALAGCLLMFSYKGYLVFLNTTEGNDAGTFNFPYRARWTATGTPFYQAPQPTFPNDSGINPITARDDLFGQGGATDCPTNESIVGANFIRDILVVYFERSTWRLRFTNNYQLPFVWERVNIELGSLCTFSTIPLDKGLMGIGNRGIVISDANDTIRFDEKIPDEIFDIRQSNSGLQRVYGIRTFRSKLIYWTFPSASNPNGIYPDQVLVYNYETNNWSFFDDCFTCFGYYYPSSSLTWAQLTKAWSATDETWGGGQAEQGFETIIAGNQQGYVLKLPVITNDAGAGSQNDPSLTITAINTGTSPATFTSPNHNLPDGTWITITGTGITSDNGVSIDGRNFKISSNINISANNFTLNEFEPLQGQNASGTEYSYTVVWKSLVQGSCIVYVGSIVFTDPNANGVLVGIGGVGGTGFISYSTGIFTLTFNSSISSTPVFIYIVSYAPSQEIDIVNCSGSYTSGGKIAKISNVNILSKIFNFFKVDERARLSFIDFYLDTTANGQFTCNVFPDSSNQIANQPLSDNLQSNVVLTSTNPYQIAEGDETIYRLFSDVIAQTLQIQLTMADQQLAVNSINNSQIGIISMIFAMRKAGRLV